MPESRHRHILGPLLLIFIGVALLLDQLGIWSVSWSTLVQWWPLLLVFLGLEVLLGRSRAGGVVLMVVALGVALLLIMRVPLQSRSVELAQESWSQPADDITSVALRLTASAGALTVGALTASDDAYQAEAQYDPDHSQVTQQATVTDGVLAVTMVESQSSWVPLSWAPWSGDYPEQWQVALTPDLPAEIDVTSGAGQIDLDLSTLQVTRLQADMGVGRMNLTVPAEGDSQVLVNAGVGELTVTVPEGTAARIHIDGGLGSIQVDPRFQQDGRYYYTAGYDESADHIEVDIDGGVGSITVQ